MLVIQHQRAVHLACLLIGLTWASAAQAQMTRFLLTQPAAGRKTGGQLQIGAGLPLPVGTAGVFTGGATVGDAANFPPLFVPPAVVKKTIMQNLSTTAGGQIALPAGVLTYQADGVPDYIGVFVANPIVYQVATTLDYSWPNAAAVLAPGGAPGPNAFAGPAGGIISYSGGTKAFGGPALFAIAAGPGAGTYAIPVIGGMTPIATVFVNVGGVSPFLGMNVVLVGASNPLGVAAQGAPTASPATSTMFGAVPNANHPINFPVGGGGCTMWCATPNGKIPLNAAMTTWSFGAGGALPGPTNMATAVEGFPFSTGLVTVSAMGAVPAEVFFAEGTDMRVNGVGNISLVAGSLSQRMLSGPNANRAWVSLNLPEPPAALGAAAALGMLVLCHGLLRRRSR
jgi:hypothetical protein